MCELSGTAAEVCRSAVRPRTRVMPVKEGCSLPTIGRTAAETVSTSSFPRSVTRPRFGNLLALLPYSLQVDEPDFSVLYKRHARDVYRFSLYLSGDFALAEDLTAETFARAWVARERIRVGSVKAYLLMIARNLYRDVTRRRAESPTAGEYRGRGPGSRTARSGAGA